MSINADIPEKGIEQKEKNRRGFLKGFVGFFAGLSILGGEKLFGKTSQKNSPDQPSYSRMSVNPFLGEIIMFAGNFAPRGWMLCDGRLLQISQHSALFSILGTIYGGDGSTTFALPDLRGRAPMGYGTGLGLSTRNIGSKFGAGTHTLQVSEMASHSHPAKCDVSSGSRSLDISPNGKLPARSRNKAIYGTSTDGYMDTGMAQNTGGGQAHNNMQPSLGINYIIAIMGIFPPQ